MPKIRILLLICLFAGAGLWAQEDRTSELTGRILHESQPVPDVHILNVSRNQATISSENGRFKIQALAGDTLYFSAVQLQRKSLVVTPAMLDAMEVIVPLEEFVNELDEVVLRPYNLSGDIQRDLDQLPAGRVVVASTTGLPNAYVKPPTQAERKLYEATSGRGLVPLNPVLNAITGRTRQLKEILATERSYNRTNRVREYYPDSLYITELGIPGDKIDDFMYYCEVDSLFPGLIESADRLKIWEFMKSKGVEYRRNNRLE